MVVEQKFQNDRPPRLLSFAQKGLHNAEFQKSQMTCRRIFVR
jgi:hypothetical protein